MTANMYYKCKICGCVCNLKYQMGYSKKHPIRYKCVCGISIRGMYEENRGISFENAFEVNQEVPGLVVYCSGEFFTVPPFSVQTMEETIGVMPTPFILATQLLNYEKYIAEFQHVLSYRDEQYEYVRAINELYDAGNYEKVKDVIRAKFDPHGTYFPLNNQADYLRASTTVNQFQFLNKDGVNRTPKTTKQIVEAFKHHIVKCNEFLSVIEATGKIESWKKKIHSICDQVYDKIDMLMPAVSLDFLTESETVDIDSFAITTTSFEDIKQLYVDLYELIGSLLVLAIGLDGILVHDDYNFIKTVQGLSVSNMDDVLKMRNKGNIIKLIDDAAPIGSLIFSSLNSDVRNSIGHYNYVSCETADSFGQRIEFVDSNDIENVETKSLLMVCYDIWQMYKTIGVFHEIIHHFKMQMLARKGEYPSFVTDDSLRMKMLKGPNGHKIYPNDLCPCGSGYKYKHCCKRLYY